MQAKQSRTHDTSSSTLATSSSFPSPSRLCKLTSPIHSNESTSNADVKHTNYVVCEDDAKTSRLPSTPLGSFRSPPIMSSLECKTNKKNMSRCNCLGDYHDILVKIVNPNAQLPKRVTHGSIGYDLFTPDTIDVPANSTVVINTGIVLEFSTSSCHRDAKVFAKIESKSGLALHNLVVLGGIIDPDYTGPLKVMLRNVGRVDRTLHSGDAVAQLVFLTAHTPILVICHQQHMDFHCENNNSNHNTASERGSRGFGEMDEIKYKKSKTDHETTDEYSEFPNPSMEKNH